MTIILYEEQPILLIKNPLQNMTYDPCIC